MLRKDPFITGEYYHLYNRGIDKRVIFKSVRDYRRFMMLLYLANSTKSFRLDDILKKQQKNFEEILIMDKDKSLVAIGAWCLMPNHFHLMVRQEVDGGITKFMKKLGTGYSMYFNIKYERQGALFGGLFKSKLVDADDNYMKQLFAYIHLNPLDTVFYNWQENIEKSSLDMKEFLDRYEYSSYQDFLGVDRIEKHLLNLIVFPDYFEEQDSFRNFVEGYYIEIEGD